MQPYFQNKSIVVFIKVSSLPQTLTFMYLNFVLHFKVISILFRTYYKLTKSTWWKKASILPFFITLEKSFVIKTPHTHLNVKFNNDVNLFIRLSLVYLYNNKNYSLYLHKPSIVRFNSIKLYGYLCIQKFVFLFFFYY